MSRSTERLDDRCERRWAERISRARQLRDTNPSAAEALHFYETVLDFQRDVAGQASAQIEPGRSLQDQVDLDLAAKNIVALLHSAIENGPRLLARHAEAAEERSQEVWQEIFRSVLNNHAVQASPDSFFARACLQPIAENLQLHISSDTPSPTNRCPCCKGLPQLSILRTEGEGASRSLQCSTCLREWPYRRLICPNCAEERKEELPRYSAGVGCHVYVEACETCKHYIKSVDMTIDGHAIPLVDEVALVVLDLWAADRGYTKLIPNLMCF